MNAKTLRAKQSDHFQTEEGVDRVLFRKGPIQCPDTSSAEVPVFLAGKSELILIKKSNYE